MTIDEAIEKYKEITNTGTICPAHCNISCDKCEQESEQIVEWLEELKELRVIFGKIIREIDELQNYACFPTEWVSCEQSKVHTYYAKELTKILKLAEQLKAGANNDKSI